MSKANLKGGGIPNRHLVAEHPVLQVNVIL